MSRELDFVLKLAEFIARDNRFPSSPHHRTVRKFIRAFLREFKELNVQPFGWKLLKPRGGILKANFETLNGVPYTNSPSGEVEGVITDCGYATPSELLGVNLKGKIALVREGKIPFRRKERLLKRKGAVGVVVCREEVDEIYSGVSAGLLPVLSVRCSETLGLNGSWGELSVSTEEVAGKGENLWLEFGKGEAVLTFVAHYDTKPFTNGAIDNGLSVALLLWLVSELALKEPQHYRVRVLFTDLEEFGLLGAEHFAAALPKGELLRSFVISVDTVGWENPSVLYRDAEGVCDRKLSKTVERVLEYLNLRKFFHFKESGSGRSDHIPFRKRGAKTLFFASNPFPYRHTPLDTVEIVSRGNLKNWMALLKVLALGLHRFYGS